MRKEKPKLLKTTGMLRRNRSDRRKMMDGLKNGLDMLYVIERIERRKKTTEKRGQ